MFRNLGLVVVDLVSVCREIGVLELFVVDVVLDVVVDEVVVVLDVDVVVDVVVNDVHGQLVMILKKKNWMYKVQLSKGV